MLDFKNDEIAFTAFMQAHQNRVFNAVLNMMQHVEDAEEITQDVFVDVYRSAENFRGDAAVSTWLYRIAMNKCIDQLRKKQRRQKWNSVTDFFSAKTSGDNEPYDFVHPGIIAEQKEKAALLYKAIDQLAVSQRMAYILSETENLPYKDIAEVMKVSVSAVESLLVRAKQNLRKILGGYYHGQ